MRQLGIMCVGILLLGSGCSRNSYELQITPRGAEFHRQLTCWHNPSGQRGRVAPLPAEELSRIGGLYPQPPSTDKSGKTVFAGVFRGQTPADLGGAGLYSRFDTPLGATVAYLERFRGNDNLEEVLARRRAAADRLCDLLLGWLQSEIGNRPNFSRLKRFMNDEFRQDLKNVSLYSWSGEVAAGTQREGSPEFLVRIGQYLYERGYLGPADVPRLATALAANDPAWVWLHVQRLVATRLGIEATAPVPEFLGFLATQEKAQASLLTYVRGTDLFKKRVAQFREQKANRSPGAEPKPEDVLGELTVEALLPPSLQSSHDQLSVSLACPRRPFETNGTWDAATGRVRWEARIQQQGTLPVVCYAFWSEPDATAQRDHFGNVLLDDEVLAQFALWYVALPPPRARQCDAFLAGCRPGADLAQRIAGFHFEGEEARPASPPAAGPTPQPNEPPAKIGTPLADALTSRVAAGVGPLTSEGAAQVARQLIGNALQNRSAPQAKAVGREAVGH